MVTLKVGDTWPSISASLTVGSEVVSLTGATVEFRMAKKGGAIVFEKPAVVVDAATGKVRYVWEAGDTDTAGTYYGEFVVTFADGKIASVPNDGYIEIAIYKALT